MVNKKTTIWLPLFISLAIAVGMYIGYYMRDAMPGKKFFSTEKQKPLQEIMSLIQNKYVDEIDMNNLADTAIAAILSKLDPHSKFIPAEKVEAVNEDINGRFFGIGVEFNIFSDTINIINVLQDGPAFKAGMQVGDKLVKVNDSLVAGVKITAEKIRSLLRGDRDTKVFLAVIRGKQISKIEVTRGMVPLVSLDASYIIENGIGYLRLNRFSGQTYKEFMTAMEKLKKEGLKKLILDLRGNGGGLLDEATAIADEFLSGDKLITYTEGSHFKRKEYRCKTTRPGVFEEGDLVVLTDEGSASASEVLCGALQDWDRATIIGRRTFGKGLVQEQFDLSNGSAIRLTIARYYTPVGRSIQRSYRNGEKAYYDEIVTRFKNGQTQTADSIKQDTTKSFKTSKGKKIFGGGGIMPDYFIATDTSNSASMEKLFDKGTISKFSYEYFLANKTTFSAYKSATEFAKSFTVTSTMLNNFSTTALKDSVKVAANNEEVAKLIKANIARIMWRGDGYFQSINSNDKGILKALELLK